LEENNSDLHDLLKVNYYYAVTGEGTINSNAVLQTSKNDRMDISLLSKPHIALRFTEKACKGCNRAILKEFLVNASKLQSIAYLCVLVPQNQVDYFYKQVKLQKRDIKVYGISSDNIDLPVEENDIPYLFLLEDNLTMSNILSLTQHEIDWIEDYLNVVISAEFTQANTRARAESIY